MIIVSVFLFRQMFPEQQKALGPRTVLAGGVAMPTIGLGLAGMSSAEQSRQTIRSALQLGYRMFDTAAQKAVWYRNEAILGEEIEAALAQPGTRLTRDELFLVTKLHPEDHGARQARDALARSLENLRVAYIDLVLIHYPRCWDAICAPLAAGQTRT